MGLACSFYQPVIVLEALLITTAVVAGLTAYAFHATRNGVDFAFMGPMVGGGKGRRGGDCWAPWKGLMLLFATGAAAAIMRHAGCAAQHSH